MAFRFRLQEVLKNRLAQEEQARRELDRRRRDLEEAERGLGRLVEARAATAVLLREQYSAGLDFPLVQSAQRHLLLVDRQIRQQEEHRDRAFQEVRRRQAELHVCWQRRRTLEILQEKAYRHYLLEARQSEQRTHDELALFGFKRGV